MLKLCNETGIEVEVASTNPKEVDIASLSFMVKGTELVTVLFMGPNDNALDEQQVGLVTWNIPFGDINHV